MADNADRVTKWCDAPACALRNIEVKVAPSVVECICCGSELRTLGDALGSIFGDLFRGPGR